MIRYISISILGEDLLPSAAILGYGRLYGFVCIQLEKMAKQGVDHVVLG